MGEQRKTIVVGLDGSTLSNKALERVIAESKKCKNVDIVLVSVAEMLPSVSIMDSCGELYKRYLQAAQQVLDHATERLKPHNLTAQTYTETGRPAQAIIDVAKRVGADEIVVGSVGKHAVERLLVGSVSARLIESAGCTVVVVK